MIPNEKICRFFAEKCGKLYWKSAHHNCRRMQLCSKVEIEIICYFLCLTSNKQIIKIIFLLISNISQETSVGGYGAYPNACFLQHFATFWLLLYEQHGCESQAIIQSQWGSRLSRYVSAFSLSHKWRLTDFWKWIESYFCKKFIQNV